MYNIGKMSRHKIIINKKFPILPGSISIAYAKCGKKNCICMTNARKIHGPYYRWTGLIDGKRTTITISKEAATESLRRIKQYKQLIRQWDAIMKKALKNAPWKVPP